MLYRKGDKVKVREDILDDVAYFMLNEDGTMVASEYYYATDEMCALRGEILTISEVSKDGYSLKESGYIWTDDMFDNDAILYPYNFSEKEIEMAEAMI